MFLDFITAPLSLIYASVIGIRNRLFDKRILRSEEFDIPVICVGNLTVGGTGKTPFTEFLIESLSGKYNLAVVSRGYKRRTKGFVHASEDSTHQQIGDEAKQIKLKYPHVEVVVCEKRVEGITKLREICPQTNLIILDDAFQHRYVEPWVSIVLMDYNRPIYKDHMLPWGRLRDSKSQLHRAHFVITTKCPSNIQPVEIRSVSHNLELFPYQKSFFTGIQYAPLRPQFAEVAKAAPQKNGPIIVMSAIASPAPMLSHLKANYNIIHHLEHPDHYAYKISDMEKLSQLLDSCHEQTIIVITEKDAAKLTNKNKIPINIQQRLYVLPIKVSFLGDSWKTFLKQLDNYVRKNQKYSDLHP
ncbi:MAG: tetraacyldisaccharide 4'-kinase [Rikenellaceae bacterium]